MQQFKDIRASVGSNNTQLFRELAIAKNMQANPAATSYSSAQFSRSGIPSLNMAPKQASVVNKQNINTVPSVKSGFSSSTI